MEGKVGAECEVFDWFKSHVLDSKLETGIEHQELVMLTLVTWGKGEGQPHFPSN
ncbi:putative serine/threonine-kinase [Trifolium medium]|uniref:Putative serine/threonine-kinase n=1 Tax=Trifolium medium TaxID=97028 RepID=A0A392ML88_9FABA|nr:putative serine/threonine-kinase [Trifolium medium]